METKADVAYEILDNVRVLHALVFAACGTTGERDDWAGAFAHFVATGPIAARAYRELEAHPADATDDDAGDYMSHALASFAAIAACAEILADGGTTWTDKTKGAPADGCTRAIERTVRGLWADCIDTIRADEASQGEGVPCVR